MALSPMIKADIERRSQTRPVTVIPNMSDVQYFRPGPKNQELENLYGLSGKFVVSYVGAIGFANGLDFIIDCARATRQAGMPVHYLLCGDGAMLEHLKNAVTRHALPNITFVPFQTREGVRQVLGVTDAALICYRPVPILETGSPNKYFDALAAGKLIFINFSGWLKQEVEAEQCGFYLSPANPSAITALIKPFLIHREELTLFQRRSRSLAERKYTRVQLGDAFVKLVEAKALSV